MSKLKWVKTGDEWRARLGEDTGRVYFGGLVFQKWRLDLNGLPTASGPTRQSAMQAFDELHAARVHNGATSG